MTSLRDPGTPFLALDLDRVDANIARLRAHLDQRGVPLRLHVKTAKAVEVATRAYGGGTGPITVSTLAEAERFADAGWTDVLYAVGIDPHKLARVRALVDRGVAMTVLLDSLAQAEALAAFCGEAGVASPALVEIDCDGHRGGVLPGDPALVEIGRV
nr:DSD1 family PLP-dependent enzyme [Actinomycetales bacterium]